VRVSREAFVSWLPAALLIFALGVGLASGWRLLHYQWTETYTYSHGYAIAAASLWLFWRTLRREGMVRPEPFWPALLPLAALMGMYALADVVAVNIVRLMLLPAALWLVTLAIAGPGVARRIFWPLGILYLAIPWWEVINGLLQDLTTLAVTGVLSLTSITAYIEGHLVYIPAGVFEIAEGCSGLRYLIVGCTLAYIFALGYLTTWSARLRLVIVAVVASLIMNWVRVFVLIVVGHVTEMRHYLIAEEHYLFGWVLFTIAIVPVLLYGVRLERSEHAAAARRPLVAKAGTLAHSERLEEPVSDGRPLTGTLEYKVRLGAAPPALVWAVTAAAGLLLAAPALLRGAPQLPPVVPAELSPPPVEGWSAGPPHADGAAFFAATAVLQAGYERVADSERVDVFLAWYPAQSDHAKATSDLNRLRPEGWQVERTHRHVAKLNGRSYQVTETIVHSGPRRRLVWHWYRIGGTSEATRLSARLLEALAALRGRRDAGVIVVSGECLPDCGRTQERMAEFLHVGVTALERLADGITTEFATDQRNVRAETGEHGSHR
jgi:EpsI family protein